MFGSSYSLPTSTPWKNNTYTRNDDGPSAYDEDRFSAYEVPYAKRDRGSTFKRIERYNSALDLVNTSASKMTIFWRRLPEVISSGQLRTLPKRNIELQEAMFELITSEASFLTRLWILEEHFIPKLSHLLDSREKRDLFEFVHPIRKTSER